jgi:hypothetical protein
VCVYTHTHTHTHMLHSDRRRSYGHIFVNTDRITNIIDVITILRQATKPLTTLSRLSVCTHTYIVGDVGMKLL